ncbi:type II toxin-antitoxin system HicB family antitoxin [uncultured Vagococcus sp.]|uniref:type II toxin-antitoxin system HicB family antitoxin n=1 Tax=uncultured Vagococcus sp. TaxID=189676 RepID=UPI0028D2C460|nr:type II toxin-antitoxin system HicB family antitoxin [uncultured Vagococcus sp.]
MKKEIYLYPIVISETKNDSSGFDFVIEIPAFNGFTQAETFEESIEMARDYIGNHLVELDRKGSVFPEQEVDYRNIGSLKKSENDIVTTVDVNFRNFKYANDNKSVRKNVTIPNYLDVLGKEHKVNFSELLTDSLRNLLVN